MYYLLSNLVTVKTLLLLDIENPSLKKLQDKLL